MDIAKETDIRHEVTGVFKLLEDFHSNKLREHSNSDKGVQDRRSRTILIGVMALVTAILVLINYFPESTLNAFGKPRVMLQVIFLVMYLCGVVVLWQSLDMLKFVFTDQTASLINDLGKTAQTEVELFEKMDDYSHESICFVAKRVDFGSEQIKAGTGLFVGSFEKLGLLPGILATTFAVNRAFESTQFSLIEGISIALIFLYLLMLKLVISANRFKRYSFVLNHYLENLRTQD